MTRPVPTVKILWILLLVSMFLNLFQIVDEMRCINKLRSYAEECGNRTDAGGHKP